MRESRNYLARGLTGQEEARCTAVYFDADDVHAELRAMLDSSKAARSGTQSSTDHLFPSVD